MVLSNKKTRKSARKLLERLQSANYEGPNINWGCSTLSQAYEPLLNPPESVANAVNKKVALELMQAFEVPVALITESEARTAVLNGFKVVGRTTNHSKGRGFYMCATEAGIDRAKRLGATHFLTYIEDAQEFRVHIVKDKSIKISTKVFPEGVSADRRNVRFGATFEYPHNFNHKKSLRKYAKAAIEALELDFGAVDLLYTENDGFIVLEVNTAPCLTDETSDTLDRYVTAFMDLRHEEA